MFLETTRKNAFIGPVCPPFAAPQEEGYRLVGLAAPCVPNKHVHDYSTCVHEMIYTFHSCSNCPVDYPVLLAFTFV